MLERLETKEIIKQTITNSVIAYARRKVNGNRNFQILDLLIPRERKIRSIVGGLETSLGTTLWEPLAKALARLNDFEVVASKLQKPSTMPQMLGNTLDSVTSQRILPIGLYNSTTGPQEIRRVCQPFIGEPINAFARAPKGHGVDVWLKKDNINYLFDIKTVQPNVGQLRSCVNQLMTWYAYFYSRYPTATIQAKIVFPYNPYQGNFWNFIIGNGWPLDRENEALVQNEFWDFCSGHVDTFSLIIESFDELRESRVLEVDLNALLAE